MTPTLPTKPHPPRYDFTILPIRPIAARAQHGSDGYAELITVASLLGFIIVVLLIFLCVNFQRLKETERALAEYEGIKRATRYLPTIAEDGGPGASSSRQAPSIEDLRSAKPLRSPADPSQQYNPFTKDGNWRHSDQLKSPSWARKLVPESNKNLKDEMQAAEDDLGSLASDSDDGRSGIRLVPLSRTRGRSLTKREVGPIR
ncbi:uncharacterized protein DNG_07924 [Cephalotrichum gorgonifer]|uniref:Uncharacterized protein n=1 Tax=Cephalotrichum gorgonifer TaxID=2041049 RepID=A0AAE8SYP7_9PEZI|nr:uncharacterized protein DNG_07924 [Cephalotrichum gorgonifer]